MNTRRIRARARERGHGRVVCVQDCDDSCVFFRRGEVQGLHVFASVPPRQFSRPLFTRANTGCNKQNLRPCRDQSGRSAAAEAPLPKRRCRSAAAMLSEHDFLLPCDGPIFFHFQRIAISVCFAVCCSHICMRPFLEFEYDQFSSIVVSDQFSRFLVNVFFNHHRMPPSCSAERDHGSSRFHYPRRELVLKSCLGSHAGVIELNSLQRF